MDDDGSEDVQASAEAELELRSASCGEQGLTFTTMNVMADKFIAMLVPDENNRVLGKQMLMAMLVRACGICFNPLHICF